MYLYLNVYYFKKCPENITFQLYIQYMHFYAHGYGNFYSLVITWKKNISFSQYDKCMQIIKFTFFDIIYPVLIGWIEKNGITVHFKVFN